MLFVMDSALSKSGQQSEFAPGSSCHADGTTARSPAVNTSTRTHCRRPSTGSAGSSTAGSVCASPPQSSGAPMLGTPPKTKPVLNQLPSSPLTPKSPFLGHHHAQVKQPKSPPLASSARTSPSSPLIQPHRNRNRVKPTTLADNDEDASNNFESFSTANSWLMDGSANSYSTSMSTSRRTMKALREDRGLDASVMTEDESLHDFYSTTASPRPSPKKVLHNSLSALQTQQPQQPPSGGMHQSSSSLPNTPPRGQHFANHASSFGSSQQPKRASFASPSASSWQQSLSSIPDWATGSQSAPNSRQVVTRQSLGAVPLSIPTPTLMEPKTKKKQQDDQLHTLSSFGQKDKKTPSSRRLLNDPSTTASTNNHGGSNQKKSSSNKTARTVVALLGLVVLVATLVHHRYHDEIHHHWHPIWQQLKELHLSQQARMQARQDALVAILTREGVTTERLLRDTDSDAHRALLWMTHNDPLQLQLHQREQQQPSQETSTTTLVLQRFALATLYFALHKHHPDQQPRQQHDGDDDASDHNHYNAHHQWHNETKWMTAAPVCEWHGIYCELVEQSDWFDATLGSSASASDATQMLQQLEGDDEGKAAEKTQPPPQVLDIVRIELPKHRLQGTLPPELRYLSQLTAMDLSHNHLTGTLPQDAESLGHFLRLTDLRLNHNLLSGVLPDSLANNMILKYLHLNHNHLRGTIPPSYGHNLRNLHEFSLSFNQLTGPLPSTVGGLKHIQVLEWNDNQLSGELPFGLCLLKSLQTLNLEFNHLQGSMPSEFFIDAAKRLRVLRVGHNLLTGHLPDEFTHVAMLEHFQVQHNELSGRLPKTMGRQLSHLKHLEINHNHFSGWVPTEWGEIESLEVLRLQYNKIGGKIPVQLGKLTNLVEFQLTNNLVQPNLPKKIQRKLVHLRLHELGVYASPARGEALQLELDEEAHRALHEPVDEEEEEDVDVTEQRDFAMKDTPQGDAEAQERPLLSLLDNFDQLQGMVAPGTAQPHFEDEEM